MKLKEEVKRKQGLAALALVKFAKAYEIEGGSRPGIGGWWQRWWQMWMVAEMVADVDGTPG
jgi:hypothetical protein